MNFFCKNTNSNITKYFIIKLLRVVVAALQIHSLRLLRFVEHGTSRTFGRDDQTEE